MAKKPAQVRNAPPTEGIVTQTKSEGVYTVELSLSPPLPDVEATFTFTSSDGKGLRTTGLHLTARPGLQITATSLRSLSFQEARARGHVALSEHIGAAATKATWDNITPFPRRRGRKPLPDAYYLPAAIEYVLALRRNPRSPFTEMLSRDDVSLIAQKDEADRKRSKVRICRKRGLLTPATPGRAGGALTDKAVCVAREAGIALPDDDN